MRQKETALLDCIETPIFVLEPDDTDQPVYVAFNEAACCLTNKVATEMLGRTARQAHDGDVADILYEHHLGAMREGVERSYEMSLPQERGLQHIRVHLKPMLAADGRVLRIVGTINEITAEAELRVERERSQTVLADLEAFTNLAAHDLRSPIRNVKVLTGLLLEDFTDLGDGKLQFIQQLGEVADKALNLIADILNHAEATGTTESIERFPLAQLCHDILAMLDPAELHVAAVEDRILHADKNTIQIVLRNLIDNAIKHNAGKSVALEITAAYAPGGHIRISVQDDGVGLDASTAAFLNGEKFRYGTGYGLMGIRSLLHSRGGSISAENPASGRGALIHFSLAGALVSDT